MQGLDLATTLFIWATIEENKELLEDEPPTMPDMQDIPDDIQQTIRATVTRKAQNFDYYRTVRHISVRLGHVCAHYVIAKEGEAGWTPEMSYIVNGEDGPISSSLFVCGSEAELLSRFWESADRLRGTEMLAGWQLEQELLPLLVHKALYYNIKVPEQYKTDPTRRFATVDNIVRLEAIYTQGSRSPRRTPPRLDDVLDWWSVPFTTSLPYATQSELLAMSQDDWIKVGCRSIEKYLTGMAYMVAKYYGYTP